MGSPIERLETLRRSFRLPALAYDLLTATEKAAASIASMDAEPWSAFWNRVKKVDILVMKPRDQVRLIRQGWMHDEASAMIPDVLEFCVATKKKAPVSTLIETYLREFPSAHRHFDALARACQVLASTQASPWYEASQVFSLFDPEDGPRKIASALGKVDEPKTAFLAANLRGELHRGGLARRSVEMLAKSYVDLGAELLEDVGRRMITILRSDKFPELRGVLVFALLLPWQERQPSSKFKNELINALVRYGDPRERGPDWEALRENARAHFDETQVQAGLDVLGRWLAGESVREFFNIIQKSAGNAQHWKSRQKFWSAYLDADLIDAAWFALGPVAERLLANSGGTRRGKFAKLLKGSSTDEQSTLIMKIGNTIIGEWSDNGACRFWLDTDPSAPRLYEARYYSTKLRTTHGGQGFTYLAHHGGWQAVFARQIKKMTGISKPR